MDAEFGDRETNTEKSLAGVGTSLKRHRCLRAKTVEGYGKEQ